VQLSCLSTLRVLRGGLANVRDFWNVVPDSLRRSHHVVAALACKMLLLIAGSERNVRMVGGTRCGSDQCNHSGHITRAALYSSRLGAILICLCDHTKSLTESAFPHTAYRQGHLSLPGRTGVRGHLQERPARGPRHGDLCRGRRLRGALQGTRRLS
jgi:hypothetical protein